MNKELETKCPVCGMPAYYREDEVIAICSECGRASQINSHIDSHDLPCIECGKSIEPIIRQCIKCGGAIRACCPDHENKC